MKLSRIFFIISIVLVSLAVIFTLVSIIAVNNSDYDYARSQYNSWTSKYYEYKAEARNSQYAIVQEMWEELADDAWDYSRPYKNTMDSYEATSTCFGVLAGVSFAAAIPLFIISLVRRKKFKKALAEAQNAPQAIPVAPNGAPYAPQQGGYAPQGYAPQQNPNMPPQGYAPQQQYAPKGYAPAPQQQYAPQGYAPAPQQQYAPQGYAPAPQQQYAPQAAPQTPDNTPENNN